MPAVTIKSTSEVEVKYLKVQAGVRYWEDAEVNGVDDEDGSRIPRREGDCWCPLISLETGMIEGWPVGTTANIHYKVCDAGRYALLDAEGNEVKSIDGYVPKMMSPGGDGYGDYIIMHIDAAGRIAKWSVDLEAFDDDE